jgi:hypothetical protein
MRLLVKILIPIDNRCVLHRRIGVAAYRYHVMSDECFVRDGVRVKLASLAFFGRAVCFLGTNSFSCRRPFKPFKKKKIIWSAT